MQTWSSWETFPPFLWMLAACHSKLSCHEIQQSSPETPGKTANKCVSKDALVGLVSAKRVNFKAN